MNKAVTNNHHRWVTVVCAVLLAITAVVVFRINQHSHLSSDDYLYSFKFNPGFTDSAPATLHYERIEDLADYVESLTLLYNNLTGRIVPHALLQFFLLLPFWVFDVFNTLALFALTYLMTLWVIGENREYLIPWWLLVTMLYYLAVYSTIPNLYLPAFSFNYLWTALIVFLFISPVLRYMTNDVTPHHNIGFAVLMLAAGLIAGDTNEPVVPGLLLAMGILGLWKLLKDKRLPLWYIMAGVGAVAGFAFLYFAPGNEQRALYEHQKAGSRSIGFGFSNVKAIVYSFITAFPGIVLAVAGLAKLRLPVQREKLTELGFMLVFFIGVMFALLFSPIFMSRLNILFIGVLLVVLLQFFRLGNTQSLSWLLAVLVLVIPVFSLKLNSDFRRMKLSSQEYALFEEQISQCPGDSCLVNPRAYLDPLTWENWAKPVAVYHGLRYLWVKDELDDDDIATWGKATYKVQAEKTDNKIELQGLRIQNNDRYSRTLYVILKLNDASIKPSDVSLRMYTADLNSSVANELFEALPLGLQQLMLREEISYRPQRYRTLNGVYVYPLQMRNSDSSDDYLRLRISANNTGDMDIRLKDIRY